ncbi:unnamed protein product [Rhizoctonia solani]|uniref:Transmembrane protein n=1 Tax=Rhizoctonia solani TaxID=456999 RepID=A0A8H2WGT1_9AGAM|nr:unnamed protein product [Rhizoctonia solani]
MFTLRQRWLLLALLLTSHLGTVCGGPINNELSLVARQATTTTEALTTQTASPTTAVSSTTAAPQTTVQSSATSVVASSVATSSVVSTTASATSITSSQSLTTTQTSTHTTSQTTSTTSNTSSSQSSSSSSTTSLSTSSASATATASSNIFDKSNRYFGYAIGVTVVVGIFVALLLVLVIRWVVQKFSKPKPSPITANAGAWRYSEDTELYSPGTVPNSANNTVSTIPLGRHKGIGAEMGEAQAFLSTESVTLYPPAKYTDEDTDPRRHSRSLSNASSSQATTTPYVQRRPISFLHNPPATHPAFIVDRDQDSNSGHGHLDAAELRGAPGASQEGQVNTTAPARSMPSMLIVRAGHSDAYRQPTLGSTNSNVSRTASTASAYSQPSAIHTPPPMPEMPPLPTPVTPRAQAQPRPHSRELSPDVSAALSTMQTSISVDTIPEDGLAHSQNNDHPTVRQTPGRMGWGRQAPSSVHSQSDLFFGHEQR